MSEEEKPSPPPPSLRPPPKAPPIEPIPKSAAPSMPRPIEAKSETIEEAEPKDGDIAPLNTRILAGVIDALVASALAFTVTLVMPDILDKLGWLVWAGYLIARDSLPFLKSGSIGKMAMKLRVEKKGGGSITGDWQSAAIRNLPLIVPLLWIVEIIVLSTRDNTIQRGVRLGDEWAGTRVVLSLPEAEEEPEA